MKKEKLKLYLDKLGQPYNSDNWCRPTELNYIILESDANQFFNPLTQQIKFDTTTGLIQIKYSHLELISGVLDRFSYNLNSKTLYFNTGRNTVYYNKKIREPKIGDYVCAYDSKKDQIVSSLISDIKQTNHGAKIVLYDSNVLNKIEVEKVPMTFFIILQGYSKYTVLDNPIEIYNAPEDNRSFSDIYIDCEKIIGFEFDKKWRPNNL